MKGATILIAVGGLGIVAFIISKKAVAATPCKYPPGFVGPVPKGQCVQTRGVQDPNYSSTANVFAADQKKAMASNAFNATPPNPIIPWNGSCPSTSGTGPCGYPAGFVGPLPDTCQPSGATSPQTQDTSLDQLPPSPDAATLSPYFFSADKVPINANLPGSDADPNLGTSWINL